MESNSYTNMAFQVTGGFAPYLTPLFEDMKSEMRKADISLSLQEYASTALFSAVLAFLFSAPIVSVIVGMLVGSTSGIVSGAIAGLFVGLLFGTLTFLFFYVFPSIRVSGRRKSIDNALPFATMYLSTLAGTGTHPAAAFEMLGRFDEFGEVSREAKKITRDVYTFGVDLSTALEGAAERTPSSKMKDLLWAINNVLTSGGDFRTMLEERVETLMADYARTLDKFTDNLSVLIELYITFVIAGSVIGIVLASIMTSIGGTNQALLLIISVLITFLYLPISAGAFILIIKSISPVN